jgi:hypothetical protein
MQKPYKVSYCYANGAANNYYDNYFKAEQCYYERIAHCESLAYFATGLPKPFTAKIKIENLETLEVYREKTISNNIQVI